MTDTDQSAHVRGCIGGHSYDGGCRVAAGIELPPDPVSHPAHYTSSPAACSGCGKTIECIDVVQHMPFNLGSVVKYVWRHDLKDDAIKDLRKAIQYLEFEIARRKQAEAG